MKPIKGTAHEIRQHATMLTKEHHLYRELAVAALRLASKTDDNTGIQLPASTWTATTTKVLEDLELTSLALPVMAMSARLVLC
jgi:hypothetical protein